MPNLVTASGVTGHRTRVLWYCGQCGEQNPGDVRHCNKCQRDSVERHAQIHASERAVSYVHPITGERKTPPRADMPMPEVYARQGFERHEIMSMVDWEKKTGSIHEASTFAPGSEPSPGMNPTPSCPKEVKEALIKDIMDAHQSGNWTMDQPLRPSTESTT